jgi:hypothetical protein
MPSFYFNSNDLNAILLWLVWCESRVRIGRVTIIVHDPATGVKKHVLSWRCHPSFARFVSNSHILCNAVSPDRGCRVNPTLKPVFQSAETGEAERLQNGNETANFCKNHQILSRTKVRWETLMGF